MKKMSVSKKKYYFISVWTIMGGAASFGSIFFSALLNSAFEKPYSHLFSNLTSGILFGGFQFLAMLGLFKRSYLWLLYTICGYLAGFLIGQIEILKLSNGHFGYFLSSVVITLAPALFLREKFRKSKILLWAFSYFLFLALAPLLFESGVNLFKPKSILLYSFFHFIPLQFVLSILFYDLFVSGSDCKTRT